ncbi:MAG: MerR family transcriptional regulator [Pseudomonadota bacterium]
MQTDPPEIAISRPGDGLYPIRTVASLTGVNPITLRAWERRYGLIRPHRTPKGHRLYTQGDIDLVNRVVQLLGQGISISRVRPLLEAEQSTEEENNKENPWHTYIERMHNAIIKFEESGLDAAYNEALALYPIDTVTEYLLLPMMRKLGNLWNQREGGIAEEHFFATYLRNKLGARFHHMNQGNDGPRLLTACLPGERHELGLMLFSLSAAARNYRSILLGADVPLPQIALAAARINPEALILSSSMPPGRKVLETELPELIHTVEQPVFIGGDTSIRHHDAIVRAGARPLGNEMAPALRRLEEQLRSLQTDG